MRRRGGNRGLLFPALSPARSRSIARSPLKECRLQIAGDTFGTGYQVICGSRRRRGFFDRGPKKAQPEVEIVAPEILQILIHADQFTGVSASVQDNGAPEFRHPLHLGAFVIPVPVPANRAQPFIGAAVAWFLFSQFGKPIRCIKRVAGATGVNHLAKLLVLAGPVSITSGLGQ